MSEGFIGNLWDISGLCLVCDIKRNINILNRIEEINVTNKILIKNWEIWINRKWSSNIQSDHKNSNFLSSIPQKHQTKQGATINYHTLIKGNDLQMDKKPQKIIQIKTFLFTSCSVSFQNDTWTNIWSIKLLLFNKIPCRKRI